MAITTSGVGNSSRPVINAIPPPRARAYAAATNDDLAAHARGDLVPPVLTYPLVQGAGNEALSFVVPDGDYGGPALHGEHDFRFHRPVRTEETVTTRAEVVGVHAKRSGTTIVVHFKGVDVAGLDVVEQYLTIFVPGAIAPESAGDTAPSHGAPDGLLNREPIAVIEQHVDDDQTWRFCGPSGDTNPIHLYDDAAVAAGLPGIINHGMNTLAVATSGLIREVAGADPARLARVAVRFSSMLVPGQTITTSVWDGGAGSFHFQTVDASGTVVMSDGLMEVRS